jgi:hypothetical protein
MPFYYLKMMICQDYLNPRLNMKTLLKEARELKGLKKEK